MHAPIPNSGGLEDLDALVEYNTCHAPKDGTFCSSPTTSTRGSHHLHDALGRTISTHATKKDAITAGRKARAQGKLVFYIRK